MANEPFSAITRQLYIADADAITIPQILYQYGIVAFVSLTSKPDARWQHPGFLNLIGDRHLYIRCDDRPSEWLYRYFSTINNFVDNFVRGEQVVLVRCGTGVSKSVTAVLVYMMQCNANRLNEARDRVSERREVAAPNWGFWKQLKLYEDDLSSGGVYNRRWMSGEEDMDEDDDAWGDGVSDEENSDKLEWHAEVSNTNDDEKNEQSDDEREDSDVRDHEGCSSEGKKTSTRTRTSSMKMRCGSLQQAAAPT